MKSIPRVLVWFEGLPVAYLGQDKKKRINPNGGPFLASDPRDAKGGVQSCFCMDPAFIQVTLRWDDIPKSMGRNCNWQFLQRADIGLQNWGT